MTQLTWASNLILGLGIAVSGFLITVLLNLEIDPADRWQVIAVLLFLLALLLTFLSVTVGVWLIVNRLREARARMHLGWTTENAGTDRDLERFRGLANRLGTRSWRLFWWQSALFGTAILFAVAGTIPLAIHSASREMPDNGCDI